MADPTIVVCAKDVWTKVATNVTTGVVHIKDGTQTAWYQTYRDTGEAAPANPGLDEAINLVRPSDTIVSAIGIDVYVQPVGVAGSVRVDLI